MLKTGALILFILTLSVTSWAANLDSPNSKLPARQSYGQVLAHVDTSRLPANVKSSIIELITRLKKQPAAACVQFHGRSGTGKTMAAAFLGKGLGRDVYRVNLAAVMSKYIGETEKNLERVFKLAAAHDRVLLFDEADALFGKRGKFKDAHDRYANIETSYLLARLEEYQGIWIVSSNTHIKLKQGLDKRCTYIIKLD